MDPLEVRARKLDNQARSAESAIDVSVGGEGEVDTSLPQLRELSESYEQAQQASSVSDNALVKWYTVRIYVLTLTPLRNLTCMVTLHTVGR